MSTLTQLVTRSQGMLQRPTETLQADAIPAPPWRIVMGQHLAPLAIVTILFAGITQALFGIVPMSGQHIVETVVTIVAYLGTTVLVAVVMKSVVGIASGRPDFDAAFALIALSQTPALLGQAFQAIGGIGPIVMFAGAVYSLVILFKGIPIVLGVPEEERWKVFGITFIAALVIEVMVLSFQFTLFGAVGG